MHLMSINSNGVAPSRTPQTRRYCELLPCVDSKTKLFKPSEAHLPTRTHICRPSCGKRKQSMRLRESAICSRHAGWRAECFFSQSLLCKPCPILLNQILRFTERFAHSPPIPRSSSYWSVLPSAQKELGNLDLAVEGCRQRD